MSTTTERRHSNLPRTAAIVAAGWVAVMALVTVTFEPMNDVLVLGPPERTLALIEGTDIRITDLRSHYAILRGTERGFVRALYVRGAGLVLPAKSVSCLRGRSVGS